MAPQAKLVQFTISLREFLGNGLHNISIISSALLATISFFYIFMLGSYLKVIVYYFLLRFTYIKPFDDYITSRYFDSIIISALTLVWLVLMLNGRSTKIFVSSIFSILLAISVIGNLTGLMTLIELATLPLIIFLLLCQRHYRGFRSKKILQYYDLNLTMNYLVIIAVLLGIYSIAISLSVVFDLQDFSVENIFTTKQIPVDNYGYEIFILSSTLSPLLLIMTFFGYPSLSLVKAILQKFRGSNKKNWFPPYELGFSKKELKRKLRIIYLVVFVLFSVTLAIIPQIVTINEDNQQIGSDSETYVEWITELRQSDSIQDVIKISFIDIRGDRPISLILLYVLSSLIDAPPLDVFEYLPVILGPALVLVVYFLTRELTSNETTSLIAASLTGLGYFQVSVGIYAGFYANWIALVIGYSALIFFFRFLRSTSKASISVFFALLVAVLFTHAYTWSVLTIVTGIFLIVSFLLGSYPRKKTILLLLVVIASVVIDVTKTLMLESLGSAGGVQLTLSLAQRSVGLKGLGLVWDTLVDATQHHFGGIFCNFIILGLVIYWLIRSDLRADFNIFIIIFLMIGIPALFFGDWIVQSRVFYNIPFQIPAAIALTYISWHKNAPKILIPIYVWLVAISIWTVSNFYEATPS